MNPVWKEIATEEEFARQDRKLVDAGDGRHIVLIKEGNQYYAIGAWCSHGKASLAIGEIEGGAIQCPLHGARFDLKTGKNLSMPATRPIPSYEVKVEMNKIWALI